MFTKANMVSKIFVGSNDFEKLYEVEAVKKDCQRNDKVNTDTNNIEIVTTNANIYYEM